MLVILTGWKYNMSIYTKINRLINLKLNIYNELKERLPYEPTKKEINWCFWDYLIFWLKYRGSLDVDYFGTQMYRKSNFVREKSFANLSRFKWRNSIQEKKYWQVFQDKRIFYSKFDKYLNRKWIIINKDIEWGTYSKFITECKNKVISKAAISSGGVDVCYWELDNEEEKEKLYDYAKKYGLILEEKLEQCEEIKSFSFNSTNTFRIITIIDDSGKVHIARAVLRIGRKNSFVDNYTSGGMAAQVDVETGIIYSTALDKKGKEYILHPDTGKQIVGYKIEDWQDYKNFAIQLAKEFPTVRYVGWDIIKNTDGKMCVIEGNKNAGIDLMETGLLYGLKPYYEAFLHNNNLKSN